MKSSIDKSEKKENAKINQNEEISEVSDENSENIDQEDPVLKINYDSFITTPYERVLAIINDAKAFILSITKEQQELVKGLEWAIKVISSHSLYSYELKDQDYLNQVSEENPDFKQFVEFVNSYNDEVIQMNKKINIIGGGKSALNSKRVNVPSSSHMKKEEEKKVEEKPKEKDKEKEQKVSSSNNDINIKEKPKTKQKIESKIKSPKGRTHMLLKNKNKSFNKFTNKEKNSKNINSKPIKLINKKNIINKSNNNLINNNQINENIKVKAPLSPQPKKITNIKRFNRLSSDNGLGEFTGKLNFLNKQKMNIDDNALHKSFSKDTPKIFKEINYPTSRIIEKTFNIFELKEIVGYDRVLPVMGEVILDAFGLVSDDIISTSKLEPFLTSVSNQYIKTTLYHNSMHGADVSQSLCLYFLNSNAEEICQSLVLDLLGILIAALGHDLGHPGFSNPFHINASSELALTYNDASCLENFHASTLFKTIRKPETDIFEKLSVQDYKTIRKRMIGNILATDMANHGKIMTVIKTKISMNNAEKKEMFELLSGNENTKFEEQQSLFDFMIHCADLAHNTKLFKISLKWVELLSEEFWLQGDKEKSMKLPVTFLCDRENYNIPKSQVGFIKGFIIPTFDCLVNIFPTLKYCIDNAKTNLNKWQRLANKGRLKGWTPEKTKQVNYKKKMILYNAISSFTDSNNTNKENYFKRKSGNVNSLSHELQVKNSNNEKKAKEQNEKTSNDKKNKMIRPNIINKTKNHDKKIHINKFQKK
jgi:hypothetical protein